MAYDSLGAFIQRLDKAGELRRIKTPVSPVLEITEIADRVMKMPGGGPALLFENVTGSKFPLAINLMGSRRRISWALGADDLEDIAAEIAALTRLPANMPPSLLGKLQIAAAARVPWQAFTQTDFNPYCPLSGSGEGGGAGIAG